MSGDNSDTRASHDPEGPSGSVTPTGRVDPPQVSVVIPTLGRWDFVRRAVRSALMQEDVEVEVLVMADGPRADAHEGTPGLDDPRVRVIADADARGVAGARNRGFDAAEGGWVAILDDDDVWAPGKLRRQVASAVAAGADFAYTSGLVLTHDLHPRAFEAAPAAADLPAHMVRTNPIPACSSNLLVRRTLTREIRFDPELMHCADWDFAVALILAARGAACPKPLVGYVQHDGAMHRRRLASFEEELGRLRDKHRRRGLAIGSTVQYRWMAGSRRESGDRIGAAHAYLRGALRYRSTPDLVRALAVLGGERLMSRGTSARVAVPEPAWLTLYR